MYQQQQKKVNEYDRELPHSYTADHHTAQHREAKKANNDNTHMPSSKQEN